MTIREEIQKHSQRFFDADTLTPHEVATTLVELTALLSSLNAEIVRAQYAYNVMAYALRGSTRSVADAKLQAQAQPEWREWKERQAQGEALVELVRSCKKYLAMAQEEQKTI